MPDLDRILGTLEAARDYKKFHAVSFFKPYLKQKEFFDKGFTKRERLLRAGNQEGKTYAGAAEAYYHLSGCYPEWWAGRRFTHPTTAWIAGITSTLVRDGPQRILCGKAGVEEAFGTGWIPKDQFADKPSLARGVTDAYDTIQVKHYTNGIYDGISTATFKSYEQGRGKFQSATLDFIWCDEEPPADIYSECKARIAATGGFIFITFTPLEGMSTVVSMFLQEEDEDRSDTVMTIYDAEHIKPEERDRIIRGYPIHEREARTMGTPMRGKGRIFPIAEDVITEDPLVYIPDHWTKIWGIDFGIDHPFAAVLQLYDRDTDTIHIHQAVRMKDGRAIDHAAAMRPIAGSVKVAWPQDGTQRESNGETLAKAYKGHGLLMLPSHATWPDGGVSTEAGVFEMYERMTTNRYKVSRVLMEGNWGDEFRNYHRDEDGKIVKKDDDLLSASRIALMMRRYAQPGKISYGTFGSAREETRDVADDVDFDLF